MSDSNKADDLKRAFDSANEKIREGLGNIADEVDFEELKKAGERLADEAAAAVKRYPVQSALAAFAVGTLVGAFIGRKK